MSDTVDCMSMPAADHPEPAEPYEVIHLGGEAAAIVPLAELRRLRAVERYASPEALEEAVNASRTTLARSGLRVARKS
jgi:hypothetical protein